MFLYTSDTIKKGSTELKKNATLAITFASLIQLIVLVNAIFARMTHAGRVCSGDFLAANDPTAGYLIDQGSFLKHFPLLCLMITLALSIVALFAVMGRFTFRKFVEEEQ